MVVVEEEELMLEIQDQLDLVDLVVEGKEQKHHQPLMELIPLEVVAAAEEDRQATFQEHLVVRVL